ncbi:hypothetical protein CLAIMM_11421 [Cladophialophora immunda]|nr:hypothetical protein CLAIMM_11421 [Cladophialophora immunda]
MPARETKVFEYPRPVSPVSADEIPICADTIVYHDQAKGVQMDAEQRAAKRQRIERCATAYLRGEPLSILTAQLRGPFEPGWRNPWAKRTIAKPRNSGTTQEKPTRLTRATKQAKDNSAGCNLSPTRRGERQEKSPDALVGKADGGRSKRNKAEDWLTRNAAHQRPENREQSLLPSSPSERRVKRLEARKRNVDLPVPVDAGNTIASNSASLSCSTPLLEQSHKLKSGLPSHLNSSAPQTAPLARNGHNYSLREKNKDKQVGLTDHYEAAKAFRTNESTAECAILNLKCGAEHHPASDTDPFASQPGDQDDSDILDVIIVLPHSDPTVRPLDRGREQGLEPKEMLPPGFNDTSAILPNPQDASLPDHSGLAAQSLAEETTKSSTTTDLPSAQVPPFPVLASLPSNLSNHSQMFYEAQDRCTAEAADMEDLERPAIVDVAAAGGTKADASAAPDLERLLPMERQEPAQNNRLQSPIHADRIGTPHSPTDHASGVPRSAKEEAGRGKQRAASPVGTTKPGRAKAKRRAVPATEDTPTGPSRGTIKSALKVAKPTVAIQDKMVRSKSAMPDGEQQQPGGDDEHRPAAKDSVSPKLSPASTPKSILKSRLQRSTRAPQHSNNRGSSSNKQDAQRQRLLELVENHDFDLDAALDEIISDLGTWDAEKEARFAAAAAATATPTARR